MRTITTQKMEVEVYDNEGNWHNEMRWVASDGVSEYIGKTESEAVAHYGVPIGRGWRK